MMIQQAISSLVLVIWKCFLVTVAIPASIAASGAVLLFLSDEPVKEAAVDFVSAHLNGAAPGFAKVSGCESQLYEFSSSGLDSCSTTTEIPLTVLANQVTHFLAKIYLLLVLASIVLLLLKPSRDVTHNLIT